MGGLFKQCPLPEWHGRSGDAPRIGQAEHMFPTATIAPYICASDEVDWLLAGCSPLAGIKRWRGQAADEIFDRSDDCSEYNYFSADRQQHNCWQQPDRGRNGTCQRAAKARATGYRPNTDPPSCKRSGKSCPGLNTAPVPQIYALIPTVGCTKCRISVVSSDVSDCRVIGGRRGSWIGECWS